ncbi:MAG TPA: RNA methyltransferase [Rhodocyclaceae bacterium]
MQDSGANPEGAHSTAKDPLAGVLSRVRVVLCRPRHPGNIGAAARAMKTMGLSRLVLVAPERYVAPDDEALARASGADDVLLAAQVVDSLDVALQGVVCAAALTARRREVEPPRMALREASSGLIEHATRGGEIALVFGGETAGLSNDEVMRCDLIVSLSTNPVYGSLNLGAAVQVLAHELRMAAAGAALADPRAVGERLSPLATRDEIEGLMRHLEAQMAATGFFDAGNPKRLMPKLRRLFGRSEMERDEVNILRGFLASIERFGRK